MSRESVRENVQRWLGHIKVLAGDIGYRLPTSEGEAKGLDYCEKTLAGLGLGPKTDRFAGAGSVFRPHLAAAILFLVAFALYPLALPVTGYVALAITLFAIFSEIMEVTLRPHPLQRAWPWRPSRNVYAVVGPDKADQDVVLIGHVDSQHTPIIFSSAGWMKAYQHFSTDAFVAFIAQAVLYAGGLFGGWTWAWLVSIIPAVMAALLVALTVQAELSPATAGANDNATAAGLVLTLAQDLAKGPLARTRVWLLCSGCEESLHEGAKTFFARHKAEMRSPRAVALEMLGCAGPAWLLKEGFVIPLRSHPSLQRIAERVAAANPELGARAGAVKGGVTEMSDAILAGVPAITIIGLTPDNVGPHWHLPTDTVDKMDPAPGGAMERNYRFVRQFLSALDE